MAAFSLSPSAITLVATIVFGTCSRHWSAASGNAAEMMKEGGRGNSSRLVNVITRVLVVGQIALTAALLIAATLANQIDPQSDASSTTATTKMRFTPRAWP